MVDLSRSLTELEGQDWGEPEFSTNLITTCHKLRYKPVSEFSAENLRIMIGQRISLDILIPVAIDMLIDDILVAGDFGEGDLLCHVLKSDKVYWDKHADMKSRLISIFHREYVRLTSFSADNGGLFEDNCEDYKAEWFEAFNLFAKNL